MPCASRDTRARTLHASSLLAESPLTEALNSILDRTASSNRSLWYGAFAGFAALLLGIGLGRFGYPPLIPVLVQQHWFNASQADYLAATNLAGYVIGAYLAGKLRLRMPAGQTIRITMLVAVASFIACVRPWGFSWFFFWRLAVGIAAGFLMVFAPPTVLARTPVEHRGRVGGIIFTGVGTGIALAGTIIPILARRGLAATWASLGIAGLILALAAWPYWKKSAETDLDLARMAFAGSAGARLTRPIVVLMAIYCATAIAFVPHTVFWVDFIARGLGRGLASGGRFWILIGFSAAAGPVITGIAADRFGFRRGLHWSLVAEAIAVGLPVLFTGPWSLALSSIGLGSMALGITALTAGRVSELVPISEQKQVWGWMTVAFSIAYAGSAWFLSFLFARVASYKLLFGIGCAVLILGVILNTLTSHSVPAIRQNPA